MVIEEMAEVVGVEEVGVVIEIEEIREGLENRMELAVMEFLMIQRFLAITPVVMPMVLLVLGENRGD